MTLRALFDVNALLAMLDDHHVHHRAIRNWWAEHKTFGWASCPLTQNGFLRVLSQASYPRSVPLPDAFDILDSAVSGTDHEFWADGYSICDRSHIDRQHVLGPNQLTDHYLLGLAVRNQGRLVTFDRAISPKAALQAEPQNLVVLS